MWLYTEHAEIDISIACVVIECLCGYILSMQKLTLVVLQGLCGYRLLVWL